MATKNEKRNSKKLRGFDNFTGLDAAGAYLRTLIASRWQFHTNRLQIRVETAAGLIVSMGNIVSKLRAFPAYVASFSHNVLPPKVEVKSLEKLKNKFYNNLVVLSQVMIRKVSLQGVFANVLKNNNRAFSLALILTISALFSACSDGGPGGPGATNPNETAATVNGKPIKMEDVERAIKQQAQGQESQLSPLELAGARLQALQSLIEQEVMFQKAEAEGTVPTDEEVNAEFNKRKTESLLSQEQFEEEMKKIGETEASARLTIKKGLAIQKLQEKITGKIEPPKDAEITQFFESNREAFKRKRGAQLAAIVIDPQDSGPDDTTKNDVEARAKASEIGQRLMQGADFATVAREVSEDPQTRLRGGDWQYFTVEQLAKAFGQGFADGVMKELKVGQIIPNIVPFEGRYLILKIQQKVENDEDRTLETPGVKQEITDVLINSRKQLLAASYQAIAMNEARIENFLAKKVVDNPNELSGARPAGAAPAANANTNAASAANSSNANAGNTSDAAASDAKPAPAANGNANSNAR